ncbi:carbon monoxide dehydrogenase subunit G [Filimonas zeae]|uniref:Putative auto-transporter adhesin head GIN domain-containing protein n=1 Tax=Filimonas zeae TaxID=1737353 RepID=A0A917J138_9BACT|nr:head GIN domain-containing protein [Filimonas zeae]MDR6338372.1 carbon monoxide dehydrogenase subunit G [Filimonas zeae]GGH68565.1 hypothetical protein GCM10011379_25020 [Filimonas zeae]
MKRKYIPLVFLFSFLTVSLLHAQTLVYDANAEVRKVESFTGIEASGGVTVYIIQGKEQAVAVSTGDEKNLSRIKTEVRNGVLRIRPESGAWNSWNWGNKGVKAYVTVTTLETIDFSGASAARVTGDLQVGTLKMELSGASSFKGSVKGGTLKIDATGASSATLAGTVQTFNAEASGASSLKGYDLTAVTCTVEASGASSISITATKEINAEASGASSIGYKGDAVIKHIDVSGASSIKRKD